MPTIERGDYSSHQSVLWHAVSGTIRTPGLLGQPLRRVLSDAMRLKGCSLLRHGGKRMALLGGLPALISFGHRLTFLAVSCPATVPLQRPGEARQETRQGPSSNRWFLS